MKNTLTIALLLCSIGVFGQIGGIGSGLSIKHSGYDTSISDTIPVIMVLTDTLELNVLKPVMSIEGYSVRKQGGYYNSYNGTYAIYAPTPLMIHDKYLDRNKHELNKHLIVLMSIERKKP